MVHSTKGMGKEMDNETFHDALYRERCRREVVENENRRLKTKLDDQKRIIQELNGKVNPQLFTSPVMTAAGQKLQQAMQDIRACGTIE